MRTVIGGSRELPQDPELVEEAVRASGFEVTSVISGGDRGIDTAAEIWAKSRGIPFTCRQANWRAWGVRAASMRNLGMVIEGQQVIAIWDGESDNTGDLLQHAQRAGRQTYVHRVPKLEDAAA